jgi:iron complex transport system substrate-binding protein
VARSRSGQLFTTVLLAGSLTAVGWCSRELGARTLGELNELRSGYSSQVDDGPFPKRLVDPLGRSHELSRAPQRIVSAALAADEILLELIAPERLVGVSYLIDDPLASPSAGRAPRAAERMLGSAEPIVALGGDLVIVGGFASAELIGVLGAANAPVLGLTRYRSFDDVEQNIELLGRATGTEARASKLRSELRERLARIALLPPPRAPTSVLALASGFVFGAGTLVDDCIRRSGALNAAAQAGLHGEGPLSIELVLRADPDLIVIAASALEPRRHALDLLELDRPWQALRAVRERRVHALPAAWLGSISQHSMLALEALAALVREPLKSGSERR